MKICVIGSGQMGQQIALISAIHGFQTINMDKNSEALERSVVWKNNYLENRLAKGQMTENQIRQVENNLRYAELEEDLLQDIDVVIEAVSETSQNGIYCVQHITSDHTYLIYHKQVSGLDYASFFLAECKLGLDFGSRNEGMQR